MIDLPKRTQALILANALLIAILAWVVISRDSSPPSAQGSQAVAVTAKLLDEPASALDLTVVSGQPIFHKTRQFIRPPDPGVPDLRPPPPSYQFAGAMTLPGKPPVAYLKHAQSGESLKVKVGEIVEGWTVSAIEPRSVALEFAGEVISIGAAQQQSIGIVAVAPRSAASESTPGIRVLTAPGQRPVTLGQPPAVTPAPEHKPRTYQPPPSG